MFVCPDLSKIFEIFFCLKNTFYGVFEVADHEYDISFSIWGIFTNLCQLLQRFEKSKIFCIFTISTFVKTTTVLEKFNCTFFRRW